MDRNWTPLLTALTAEVARLGPKGRLLNAIALMQMGERNPSYHLDMRLGGNAPSFREAAGSALEWAAKEKA